MKKSKSYVTLLKEVTAKWGETHDIEKVMGTEVDLTLLNDNQSVVWGDGETFHWRLTKKPIEQPKDKNSTKAIEVLTSARILHNAKIINETEYTDIKKRIMDKYMSYLSPLR